MRKLTEDEEDVVVLIIGVVIGIFIATALKLGC